MGIAVDYNAKVINITSPTIAISAQDLHDFIEDERTMASPEGLGYDNILSPEGKIEDPSNPGVFSQIILVLNSPWQIQFWSGSGYTRVYGGKLVGGLNDQPIKATGTAGDITVLESPVDGVTIAVPATVSATEVADAVWDETVAEHQTGGTYGAELATKADIAASASTDQEQAGSGSVVYGTETSGTYVSTAVRDGTYWQITEDATNGITVEMTFNLPSIEHRPGAFSTFGRYTGFPALTHHIELYAYNYQSSAWEQLVEDFMPGGNTSDEAYTHEYFERHIDRDNSSEIKIRLVHHVTSYNATHNLYLDYAEVSSINVITGADIADAVWDEDITAHTTVNSAGEAIGLVESPVSASDIADAVWDEVIEDHQVVGSFGYTIVSLLGVSGENVHWTGMTFDSNNNMTGATITQFTDKTLVTPRKVWTVTATYNANSELTDYQLVEV